MTMRFTAILILVLTSSCSSNHDNDLLIGDLTFDIWRMSSFYNLPDSLKGRIELGMDTTNTDFNHKGEDKSFIDIFNKLKKDHLLYKPSVDIRPTRDSIITLYLDSADYDRIKIYKRADLIASKKRVLISGRTKKIGQIGQVIFLYCTNLIDVKLRDGETYPRGRSKFKIEDYD
jgi:hypothetical protein